jgi:hypothetical protein
LDGHTHLFSYNGNYLVYRFSYNKAGQSDFGIIQTNCEKKNCSQSGQDVTFLLLSLLVGQATFLFIVILYALCTEAVHSVGHMALALKA